MVDAEVFPAIARADRVTGEHKAAMLRRALREPEGPDCPASYLRRHGRLRALVDEEAAAVL